MCIFGGNFAIGSWAFANGQLLAISSNSALFSLLGTIYGGDGRTSPSRTCAAGCRSASAMVLGLATMRSDKEAA